MNKILRITISIFGFISSITWVSLILGFIEINPEMGLTDIYSFIVLLCLFVFLPLGYITPIILLISDLIYRLRKKTLSKAIQILDIVMILFWIIVGVYTYFSIIKFEWFINTNEMITYLLLCINIIIWILQIIFTVRWDNDLKKNQKLKN